MRLYLLFSLIACFCLPSIANSFGSDGATIKILSQQLAAQRDALLQAKERLNELKTANDEIFKLRDSIDSVYDEYKILKNFDIEYELSELKRQYQSLTHLDELAKAESLENKYWLLHDEISKRFKRESKTKPNEMEDIEREIHKTLVDLHLVEKEIQLLDDQLEKYRQTEPTDKELQYSINNTNLKSFKLLLEEKQEKLQQENIRKNKLAAEKEWDSSFRNYLANPRGNVGSITNNSLIDLIVNVLNPQHVYKGMVFLSSIPTLFLFLLILVALVRLYQEGSASIRGESKIGDAIRSLGAMTVNYIAYFVSGFLIFSILFAYYELFDGNIASIPNIHDNLLELREQITEERDFESWLNKLLVKSFDAFSILSASVTWLLYQKISINYVIITQLISLLFAMAMALLWALGFIAIPTSALRDRFNLTTVWAVSIFGLLIWGIVESILLVLVASINYFASSWVAQAYSGAPLTAIAVWHSYAVIIMALIILIKVLAIWIAYQLSQNQSILGSIAGGVTAITYLLSKDAVPSQNNGPNNPGKKGILDAIRPDSGGGRSIDKIAGFGEKASEGVANVLNASPKDLAKTGVRSFSTMGEKISGLFNQKNTPSGVNSVSDSPNNQSGLNKTPLAETTQSNSQNPENTSHSQNINNPQKGLSQNDHLMNAYQEYEQLNMDIGEPKLDSQSPNSDNTPTPDSGKNDNE